MMLVLLLRMRESEFWPNRHQSGSFGGCRLNSVSGSTPSGNGSAGAVALSGLRRCPSAAGDATDRVARTEARRRNARGGRGGDYAHADADEASKYVSRTFAQRRLHAHGVRGLHFASLLP